MKYRVWIDPAYHKYSKENDPLYGAEYDVDSDVHAARAYAEKLYSELQHCDPGMFLVRSLDSGVVTGHHVYPRIVFYDEPYVPVGQSTIGEDSK